MVQKLSRDICKYKMIYILLWPVVVNEIVLTDTIRPKYTVSHKNVMNNLVENVRIVEC